MGILPRRRIPHGHLDRRHPQRSRGNPPESPLLAPVEPPSILAIGQNYRRHAAESGAEIGQYPVLFMKGLNTLSNPGDEIVLPRKLRSDKVDYEGELAFVISKRAKNVSKENAMDYVLGFTIANDVSARDWQREWAVRNGSRANRLTLLPDGALLGNPRRINNWQKLKLTTTVSGEFFRIGTRTILIYDIPTLIEFLSGSTTLLPGTVVLTGTPHGVGMARNPPRWLQAGDTVEVEIEGIGVLKNTVTGERVEIQKRERGVVTSRGKTYERENSYDASNRHDCSYSNSPGSGSGDVGRRQDRQRQGRKKIGIPLMALGAISTIPLFMSVLHSDKVPDVAHRRAASTDHHMGRRY